MTPPDPKLHQTAMSRLCSGSWSCLSFVSDQYCILSTLNKILLGPSCHAKLDQYLQFIGTEFPGSLAELSLCLIGMCIVKVCYLAERYGLLQHSCQALQVLWCSRCSWAWLLIPVMYIYHLQNLVSVHNGVQLQND